MNNLKAPRYRIPRKTSLDDDFFKYLYEKYPEFKYKYTNSQIKKIILNFNDEFVNELITNRDGVEIPLFGKHAVMMSFLGDIEKSKLDYGLFNKTNGEIRRKILNQHTNGLRLKAVVQSSLKKPRSPALNFYAFSLERSASRKCSAAFKTNYNFYQRWINKKELIDDDCLCTIDSDTYNEFEL